jgi:hypothetical protein
MTIKYLIPGIILCAVLIAHSPSRAELRDANIQSTRSYLDGYGLNTGEWQKSWGSGYYSSSPFKAIRTGSPETDGTAYLAYTIDGDLQNAEKLSLVLRVNNISAARTAHEEMLTAAVALGKKVLGGPLPEIISQAIIQGNNARARVGNTSITVIRTDWSTGTGYNLKLLFE